jgi:hypothetical protein
VLLSHCGPVSFGRDESGRTASRGAGGLVTALIGADAGPVGDHRKPGKMISELRG